MHLVHECDVRAPASSVFGIGADIERWPALDPAYRWCRIIDRDGGRTVFEMAGNIRGWPGRWTAIQDVFPADLRIVFTHIRGITTGMRVAWDIREAGPTTALRITHNLALKWPLIGRAVSDRIIGPIFIDWIARRTLAAVQRAAESSPHRAALTDGPAATAGQVRTGREEVTE